MSAENKIATLSFDDGGMNDAIIIRLLDARKIRGTFYLPSCALVEAFYDGLGKREIADLYWAHEVGGHGRLHKSFRKEPCNLREEIEGNREDLVLFFGAGRKFQCFAYPYGDTVREAVEIVRHLYAFGRTILRSDYKEVAKPKDPALMPITAIFAKGSHTEEIVSAAIKLEMPIHLLTHPWELGLKWTEEDFDSLLLTLQEAGYAFMDNFNFFLNTVKVKA
jgi:peptidoglycan/xylan/chitin deacetylase (PgdA/CDA1 family)